MNRLNQSNTRFIYQKINNDFNDFIDAVENVDNYVTQEKSLDFFHRDVVLLFKQEELFCGREVIGFPSNIATDLDFMDIDGLKLELIDSIKSVKTYEELNDYAQIQKTEYKYLVLKLSNKIQIEFSSFRVR